MHNKDIVQTTILGCRVDAIRRDKAIAYIVELAEKRDPCLVVTLGTEMIVRAHNEPAFRAVLNSAELSLCDTVGVLYAARLRNVLIPELVTGVDLIDPLCKELAAKGLRVFFLGAKGDTAQRVAAVLTQRYPNLQVAGFFHGYFPPNEDTLVAAQIAKTAAQVVLVGLGSPRQEYWLAGQLRASGCSVGIGVGGSFDILAGNVKRAPKIWQDLQLEWFYRLLREPTRWKRQLALPTFVWLALCEAINEERGRLKL